MIYIQTAILTIALMIPFSVYPEESNVTEHTDIVCKALALDAVDIGKAYVKNYNTEEAAEWVVNRIARDSSYVIFAPGDLQIILTMKGVDIEFDDIPRFAMAVYKTCVQDDKEGWVQPYIDPKPFMIDSSPKIKM